MQRYSWEQGVCAQAFLESDDIDTVICLSYEAVNRQSPDGKLANIGNEGAVSDHMAIMEALIKAYEVTQDPTLQKAIDISLSWILTKAPRNENGVVYHTEHANQFWVDSLYMLPPALLAAGQAEESVRQADGYIEFLYDIETRMFHHIWDADKQEYANSAYWGVGNGWALSGLARLIDGLPEELSSARKRYIEVVRGTIEACLKYKRADNLFCNVLDQSDTFMEVNFAQMLCYTIAKGVKGKWLPDELLKETGSIRKAIHAQVSHYGFVQNVCGAPSFDKPGIAPEGQAFFLLMESLF